MMSIVRRKICLLLYYCLQMQLDSVAILGAKILNQIVKMVGTVLMTGLLGLIKAALLLANVQKHHIMAIIVMKV